MLKSTAIFCFFLSLVIILSCKKSNSNRNELGNLELKDVYGLIIPLDTSAAPSVKKLYKISSKDSIEAVIFSNVDGFNMTGYYAPEYFYQLNDQYFIATLSVVNSQPKEIESFIVKYSDGKVFKLPAGFYPMKSISGNWVQETDENPIKAGPNSSYYFRGVDRIFKITQTALDLFDTQVLDISGTSADVFEIDNEGEIMVGDKIYTSPTVFYKSSVYSASNSHVTSSFDRGFAVVKIENNKIITFHSYLSNNKLQEDTVTVINDNGNGWNYKGSYKFSNPSQLIHVFDKGMLKVNAVGASMLVFGSLPITSIEISAQSKTHLFLMATNDVNDKILLQITPANDPPTYSQIFTPNTHIISHLNVSGNDNFVFESKLLPDQKNILGYYSSLIHNEVINYQKIAVGQLITIK